jgi:ppGpp synthetase/RelA/SpoT-type nucleotidyltranferase
MGVSYDLVKAFKNQYDNQRADFKAYLDTAENFLTGTNGLTDHGVNNAVVTKRLKSITSAMNSIQRRNNARSKPFQDLDEINSALHDLAGIRIVVRYPAECLKALNFLEQTFNILKVNNWYEDLHKGAGNESWSVTDMDLVKTRIRKRLDHPNDFAGYQAIHVHAQVRQEDLKANKGAKRVGDWLHVEIQIGTSFMFACAGIAEDLRYKPVGDPTDEEKSLLDVIGGTTMTADRAARCLGEMITRRREKSPVDADGDTMILTISELDEYISKILEARGVNVSDEIKERGWRYLGKLLEILWLTEHNRRQMIKNAIHELLNTGRLIPENLDRHFPVLIMRHVCAANAESHKTRRSEKDVDEGGIPLHIEEFDAKLRHARKLALNLVRSLNIATHFHRAADYIQTLRNCAHSRKYNVSFGDFLSILHPSAQISTDAKLTAIITFCTEVLDVTRYKHHGANLPELEPLLPERAEIFTTLPQADIMVRPIYKSVGAMPDADSIVSGRLWCLLDPTAEEQCELLVEDDSKPSDQTLLVAIWRCLAMHGPLTWKNIYNMYFVPDIAQCRWKEVQHEDFHWQLMHIGTGEPLNGEQQTGSTSTCLIAKLAWEGGAVNYRFRPGTVLEDSLFCSPIHLYPEQKVDNVPTDPISLEGIEVEDILGMLKQFYQNNGLNMDKILTDTNEEKFHQPLSIEGSPSMGPGA